MFRLKVVVGVVVSLCTLAWLASPALAVEEEVFVKVGHTVQAKVGEVMVSVTGAFLLCAGASGKGSVISSKQMKLETTLSSCTTYLGEKEEGLKATVTSCGFSLSPEGTATLEKGCHIESTGCVIEPSETENKNLEEVGYFTTKEVEEGEKPYASVLFFNIGEITYKAKGITCELAGIKGGKGGELVSLTEGSEEGAQVVDNRFFEVKPDTPAASRKIEMKSATAQVFTFRGKVGKINCAEMKLSGTVPATVTTTRFLSFTTIVFGSCTTNILGANESMTVTVAPGCELTPFVYPGKAISPRSGSIGLTGNCLKFKVGQCAIVMGATGISTITAATYVNAVGPPATVTMKTERTGEPGFSWFPTSIEGKCPDEPYLEFGVVYKGENKIKAEFNNSTSADIKII